MEDDLPTARDTSDPDLPEDDDLPDDEVEVVDDVHVPDPVVPDRTSVVFGESVV